MSVTIISAHVVKIVDMQSRVVSATLGKSKAMSRGALAGWQSRGLPHHALSMDELLDFLNIFTNHSLPRHHLRIRLLLTAFRDTQPAARSINLHYWLAVINAAGTRDITTLPVRPTLLCSHPLGTETHAIKMAEKLYITYNDVCIDQSTRERKLDMQNLHRFCPCFDICHVATSS